MSAARRVRRVHLAAASDALVRRGAILLEDALRTASLPAVAASRVLVIRSLPVGVIRADRSPASLALVIEQRVADLARGAVYAEDPAAERADAVYFRDEVEVPVLVALRLARGEQASAWFWPLAVPGHRPGAPREEGLRLAVARALATSAGSFAALHLVETLAVRGLADPLLGALRSQDGSALLRALGWSPAAPTLDVAEPAVEAEKALPALRVALARWAPAWGAGDARSLWLAAAALVAGRPGRLVDARLEERARRLARSAAHPHDPQEPGPPAIPGAAAPRERAPASGEPIDGSPPGEATPPALGARPRDHEPPTEPHAAPPAALEEGRAGVASERPRPPPVAPAPPITPEDDRPDTARIEAAASPTRPPVTEHDTDAARSPSPWPEAPLPTALGGLLFLLPVLERLGIAALLERDPDLLDLDVPARVLLDIGERLRADPGDAMLRLLRGGAQGRAPCPRDVRRPLVIEARRWCRRNARLGLHDLVVRPARLHATETHVDVILDLRDADLRVRRAGLDVDPGWVPWFGRVVKFHYVRGGSDER